MAYQGFIFDIDGTLTATGDLIISSFNHVTEKYMKRSYTLNEIIDFFGPTEETIIRQLMEKDFDAAQIDYFSFYSANHSTMVNVYAGLEDVLKSIKEKGYPLGIYTGKGRRSTLITLKETGLSRYFDHVMTGDDVKTHKPSPEGILSFAEKYDLNTDEILFVGDSIHDIKAARNSGCHIASVLWDSYGKEEVEKAGSDYYFYTVDEFAIFVNSLI